MFLIVDGENKTGKDTLIKALHKATNYKYPVINRWCMTSFVYGKYFKRDLDFNSYFNQDFKMRNDALLIYLTCPKEELLKRFIKHNEIESDENAKTVLKDYDELQTLFKVYLAMTPLKYIIVDTSLPIDTCVQQILEAIETFSKDLFKEVEKVSKHIELFGERVGNTKEIRDVNLQFSSNDIDCKCAMHIASSEEYKKERPEYYQIYASLNNLIRLKLQYFKNQDIQSRQFVYHADSCISFIQLLMRNNILEVYAVIRSSNVEKLLLEDCLGIHKIASWLNEQYFKCKEIKYNVNIKSAHIFI